jgi:hypothetical protein
MRTDSQRERERERDGRTDRRKYMTELIVAFHSFANVPTIGLQCNALFHVVYLPPQI